MSRIPASVGVQPDKPILVLLMLIDANERDRVGDLLVAMREQGSLPRTSSVVTSFADPGELLLVLPASDKERLLRLITERLRTELSLQVQQRDMLTRVYETMLALAHST